MAFSNQLSHSVFNYLIKKDHQKPFLELFEQIHDKDPETIVLICDQYTNRPIKAIKVYQIWTFQVSYPDRFYISDVSEPGSKFYDTRLDQYMCGVKKYISNSFSIYSGDMFNFNDSGIHFIGM